MKTGMTLSGSGFCGSLFRGRCPRLLTRTLSACFKTKDQSTKTKALALKALRASVSVLRGEFDHLSGTGHVDWQAPFNVFFA